MKVVFLLIYDQTLLMIKPSWLELMYIYINKKSKEYRDYIDNEFTDLMIEIKNNEGCVDSEIDCYKLLYEYLGYKPSKWEVKLLGEMLI